MAGPSSPGEPQQEPQQETQASGDPTSGGAASGGATSDRPRRDRPASAWNDPPGFKLVDVPGLLLVAGIAIAGFVLAFLVVHLHR